jgi:hypothetical protein
MTVVINIFYGHSSIFEIENSMRSNLSVKFISVTSIQASFDFGTRWNAVSFFSLWVSERAKGNEQCGAEKFITLSYWGEYVCYRMKEFQSFFLLFCCSFACDKNDSRWWTNSINNELIASSVELKAQFAAVLLLSTFFCLPWAKVSITTLLHLIAVFSACNIRPN